MTCCALSVDGTQLITGMVLCNDYKFHIVRSSMSKQRSACSGSLDETVRVWDVVQGTELRRYECQSKVFSLGLPFLSSYVAVGLVFRFLCVVFFHFPVESGF